MAMEPMSSGLPPRASHRFDEITTAAITPRAMHNPYRRNGPMLLNDGLGIDAIIVADGTATG